MSEPAAYRYLPKSGKSFYGIPARDLTQAEYDALSPGLQREVRMGGAYTVLKPEKPPTGGQQARQSGSNAGEEKP